jgi:hypothetical protein
MGYAKLLAQRFLEAKARLEEGVHVVNHLANGGMILLNMYQWTGEEKYLDGGELSLVEQVITARKYASFKRIFTQV